MEIHRIAIGVRVYGMHLGAAACGENERHTYERKQDAQQCEYDAGQRSIAFEPS
jgi:hypothetical protein